MSRIKRLIQSYNKFITIPWRDDTAAAQRVIFCVYDEDYELKLRAKIWFRVRRSEWNVAGIAGVYMSQSRASGTARLRLSSSANALSPA